MDTRVERLIKEYHVAEGDVAATKELEAMIQHRTLLKALGKEKVATLLKCLHEHNLPTLVQILLRDYYDPLYSFSEDKTTWAAEVCTDDLDAAAKEIASMLV
jgi:hypothetical protein